MKKEGWIPLDAKTIPYWSRLNAAIGNVTASIMLTQMEYWFARYPKGFYKFRGRPEHPHPAYQEGKSWTEELSITISQYKTAFQKLGTVFPKDCKWDTDFGEMAFRGMLYASHFHPRDGLQWYYRNHGLADAFLSRVCDYPWIDVSLEIWRWTDDFESLIKELDEYRPGEET